MSSTSRCAQRSSVWWCPCVPVSVCLWLLPPRPVSAQLRHTCCRHQHEPLTPYTWRWARRHRQSCMSEPHWQLHAHTTLTHATQPTALARLVIGEHGCQPDAVCESGHRAAAVLEPVQGRAWAHRGLPRDARHVPAAARHRGQGACAHVLAWPPPRLHPPAGRAAAAHHQREDEDEADAQAGTSRPLVDSMARETSNPHTL
jgi:hypothetical protein